MVSSKSIKNKGWDENTGWYNPPVATITFKDVPENKYGERVIRWATADTIIQDHSLIDFYKSRPNSAIEETIGFKGFLGTIKRQEQRADNRELSTFGTLYKVPSFDLSTVRGAAEITHVYWSDKWGIVAYDLKNGERWILAKKY